MATQQGKPDNVRPPPGRMRLSFRAKTNPSRRPGKTKRIHDHATPNSQICAPTHNPDPPQPDAPSRRSATTGGLQRLGNLIALCDGHRAGFGPSVRRATPGITRKMVPNWMRGLDQIQ